MLFLIYSLPLAVEFLLPIPAHIFNTRHFRTLTGPPYVDLEAFEARMPELGFFDSDSILHDYSKEQRVQSPAEHNPQLPNNVV